VEDDTGIVKHIRASGFDAALITNLNAGQM
jgi:hypothetical protein